MKARKRQPAETRRETLSSVSRSDPLRHRVGCRGRRFSDRRLDDKTIAAQKRGAHSSAERDRSEDCDADRVDCVG